MKRMGLVVLLCGLCGCGSAPEHIEEDPPLGLLSSSYFEPAEVAPLNFQTASERRELEAEWPPVPLLYLRTQPRIVPAGDPAPLDDLPTCDRPRLSEDTPCKDHDSQRALTEPPLCRE